jgi:hypothetical protein
MLRKVIIFEFILFSIDFLLFEGFGYVAILMLCILIGFIVILDVLKYGFGIDPVKTDRDALRKRNMKKIKKKVTPTGPKVAYRFQYVN